jgi:glycosyltransferase involved in cell wall biosynthesis
MAQPRVLIVAEAANPEWVSVPLVGWSLASNLREVADVHIVTQVRNREAFLRAGLIEGKDFTSIDSEAFAAPLWRLAWALGIKEGKGWTIAQAIQLVADRFFDHLVWKRFGPEIKAKRYDIVHRVTPLSPTIGSASAAKVAKAGVAYVVGPLNGGVPWPKAFDAERRREREWLSYIRGAYKLIPSNRAMLRAASAILVGSRHTASEIPAAFQDRCIYLPENAIDPARFDLHSEITRGETLRLGFVGRLVPYKGADMLLEAAADLVRSGRAVIDLVGDGPMMAQLRDQAKALGIESGVNFHGWKAHHEVQGILKSCHLLAFPSIREFGGGVVLEAMALGVAPLIVDYAGPGELVQPGFGFKVPLGTRAEIVAAFRAELHRLDHDRDSIATAGKAARARILQHFTWAAKAGQIAKVYDWVLRRGEKPSFF